MDETLKNPRAGDVADAIVARAAAATARENDGNAWRRDEKTHHLDNT
jgi:hypothetical protein